MRKWTEEEDRALRQGIMAGRTGKAIAAQIDRTASAVQQRAGTLGIRIIRGTRKPPPPGPPKRIGRPPGSKDRRPRKRSVQSHSGPRPGAARARAARVSAEDEIADARGLLRAMGTDPAIPAGARVSALLGYIQTARTQRTEGAATTTTESKGDLYAALAAALAPTSAGTKGGAAEDGEGGQTDEKPQETGLPVEEDGNQPQETGLPTEEDDTPTEEE